MVAKAGDLAFFDAFTSGMVPCKIIEVESDGFGYRAGGPKVTVKITADQKAYRKGELVTSSVDMVCPRECLVRRGIYFRIKTDYKLLKSKVDPC